MQQETKKAVTSMEEGVAQVQLGTKEAGKSGEALREILHQNTEVSSEINQIAVAAEQENATVGEISANIQRISGVMSDTAKRIQENASAASQLAGLAKDLQNTISHFKL
jgi:methyl-accepting chemotaxis protein